MRRPLALLVMAVLTGGAAAARAQAGAADPAGAGAGRASPSDAGVGDSTYGCVESVPKGAQRPSVADAFPHRGTSGWAATLSVTVRHGKGEKVLPSGLDLSGAVEAKKVLVQAGFRVPDQEGGAGARIWTEPEDPATAGATTHLELPLVPLPKEPGRSAMVLPPLPVAVARANGEIATVCTRPHTIVVEDPIANAPDAMPKDNPPGLAQREEWTALKKALGWASLGLLVGAILALFVWRRLSRPKPEPPPPPPRPPWEVALEELDEVRHAGLLEARRYSEYFDRTSDALRRYLGARFGFDGLESTTDEILSALDKQAGGFIRRDAPDGGARAGLLPAPGVSFDRVARFLRECDLVKFANLTPTSEQCATSITTGEAIVRGTMPASMGAAPVEAEAAPAVDPVAQAQLRAPLPPARPARSPYEPPDPDEAAAEEAHAHGEIGAHARGTHDADAHVSDAHGGEPPPRDPEGGAT